MPSLADVAPPELSTAEVDIRGTKLKVFGLSGEQWMRFYAEYPELAALLSGQTGDPLWGVKELRAYSAVVAAALGVPGDEKTEAMARDNLSRDDLWLIVGTAIRISQPGHVFGPLLNGAAPQSPAPATEAPATK